MNFTPEQLDSSIEKAINKYVNGKIDAVKTEQVHIRGDIAGLRKEFNDHVAVIIPVLNQFNDRRGFWNTMSSYQKNVGATVAIITGLGIIAAFLLK